MKTVWDKGFEARPEALSLACVELANNGHYVGKYLRTGRHQSLAFFHGKDSEANAHVYALLWNGPEACKAMYPDRY